MIINKNLASQMGPNKEIDTQPKLKTIIHHQDNFRKSLSFACFHLREIKITTIRYCLLSLFWTKISKLTEIEQLNQII